MHEIAILRLDKNYKYYNQGASCIVHYELPPKSPSRVLHLEAHKTYFPLSVHHHPSFESQSSHHPLLPTLTLPT